MVLHPISCESYIGVGNESQYYLCADRIKENLLVTSLLSAYQNSFSLVSMVAMGAACLTGKAMPAANTAATPPAWPTASVERQFLPQNHPNLQVKYIRCAFNFWTVGKEGSVHWPKTKKKKKNSYIYYTFYTFSNTIHFQTINTNSFYTYSF